MKKDFTVYDLLKNAGFTRVSDVEARKGYFRITYDNPGYSIHYLGYSLSFNTFHEAYECFDVMEIQENEYREYLRGKGPVVPSLLDILHDTEGVRWSI